MLGCQDDNSDDTPAPPAPPTGSGTPTPPGPDPSDPSSEAAAPSLRARFDGNIIRNNMSMTISWVENGNVVREQYILDKGEDGRLVRRQ